MDQIKQDLRQKNNSLIVGQNLVTYNKTYNALKGGFSLPNHDPEENYSVLAIDEKSKFFRELKKSKAINGVRIRHTLKNNYLDAKSVVNNKDQLFMKIRDRVIHKRDKNIEKQELNGQKESKISCKDENQTIFNLSKDHIKPICSRSCDNQMKSKESLKSNWVGRVINWASNDKDYQKRQEQEKASLENTKFLHRSLDSSKFKSLMPGEGYNLNTSMKQLFTRGRRTRRKSAVLFSFQNNEEQMKSNEVNPFKHDFQILEGNDVYEEEFIAEELEK